MRAKCLNGLITIQEWNNSMLASGNAFAPATLCMARRSQTSTVPDQAIKRCASAACESRTVAHLLQVFWHSASTGTSDAEGAGLLPLRCSNLKRRFLDRDPLHLHTFREHRAKNDCVRFSFLLFKPSVGKPHLNVACLFYGHTCVSAGLILALQTCCLL